MRFVAGTTALVALIVGSPFVVILAAFTVVAVAHRADHDRRCLVAMIGGTGGASAALAGTLLLAMIALAPADRRVRVALVTIAWAAAALIAIAVDQGFALLGVTLVGLAITLGPMIVTTRRRLDSRLVLGIAAGATIAGLAIVGLTARDWCAFFN